MRPKDKMPSCPTQVRLDQVVVGGFKHHLRTPFDLELAHDLANVELYCIRAEEQTLPDFLVSQPRGHEPDNASFLLSQDDLWLGDIGIPARTLHDRPRNFGIEHRFAAMDGPDGPR